MVVLGIETSCDECSFGIVEDGRRILGLSIESQTDVHAGYKGVVPELASRRHTERILPLYLDTLRRNEIDARHIDAVAVTVRPGLSGSLVTGLSFAKGLAMGLDVPLSAVDHILAHVYAIQLTERVEYPYLALIVSGGHTLIALSHGANKADVLGATLDDACGEAFDKIAAHYDLGFPGGPAVEKYASRGKPVAKLPLGIGRQGCDVSYSGLKTATIRFLDRYWPKGVDCSKENIAASFQRAAIETLLVALRRACSATGINRVVLGGGVAANTLLRNALRAEEGVEAHIPPTELCTDNGAMIAGIGYHVLQQEGPSPLNIDVRSRVGAYRHAPKPKNRRATP